MILITGATGNVGREVVTYLTAENKTVSAVTRDPRKAGFPASVRVVAGNPSDRETLSASLQGVEAILLSPRTVGESTANLLSLARTHGVKRVVVISAVTVEYGGGYRRFAEGFKAVEDATRQSGLEWCFLRCAQFASNAAVWAPQIRAGSVVRGAYGEAAVSPIHPRDVAAVATRALLDAGHIAKAYALTGPRPLSQRDQVRIIGERLGRDISWQEISPEEARQEMIAQGMPAEIPDRMLGYLAECLREPGPSTPVLQELLGRPALTLSDWVSENAHLFGR